MHAKAAAILVASTQIAVALAGVAVASSHRSSSSPCCFLATAPAIRRTRRPAHALAQSRLIRHDGAPFFSARAPAPSRPFSSSPHGAATVAGGGSDAMAVGSRGLVGFLSKRPTMTKSLAFLAGLSDVLVFRRHGCYANMMTGNFVKLTTAAGNAQFFNAMFFVVLVSSYLLGFSSYRAADRFLKFRSSSKEKENGRPSTPAIIAPVVFTTFALYDVLYGFVAPSRWFVPILAVGSALVNAAGAESTGLVTCMMTGNLQKIANYAADSSLYAFLRGAPLPSDDVRAGARRSVSIIASFGIGIILAVAACGWWSGSVAASTAVGKAVTGNVPPFAILGAMYSLLLVAYSRPAGFMPQRFLRYLKVSAPTSEDDDASELDINEAVCFKVETVKEEKETVLT